MKNQPQEVPEDLANIFVAIFNNYQANRDFARTYVNEPRLSDENISMFNQMAASCSNWIERMRNKAPKDLRSVFDHHLTNNDPFKYQNILRLYSRMSPETQEQYESLGEGMVNGTVQFVDDEK